MFELISKNKPAGDQPDAIAALVEGVRGGLARQTLLGVTGSGKTFTVANVIREVEMPTLVIAHNKTLAAQLCNEFRMLFPKNAVHYFVSYYDYYQPEAYIPSTDTYIGKEAMINDEIDRLRHAATTAVLTRPDTIVVASVSSLYGLGSPETYRNHLIELSLGETVARKDFIRELVRIQFSRTNSDLKRGTFRLRGGTWEIMPAEREIVYEVKTEGDRVTDMREIDPTTRRIVRAYGEGERIVIAPARHFITEADAREGALAAMERELQERLAVFEKEKKYLEAERLERRTKADIAMMREVGYCNGIENYSRHLSGRAAGEPPETLLDYFRTSGFGPFLTVIDESHVTLPQLRGMFAGDHSRKATLIEHGFRLPSAADNRPLTFDEFNKRVGQIIFTSATPGDYEIQVSRESVQGTQRKLRRSGRSDNPRCAGVVEQIIRPTGLIDPEITLRPAAGQVDDLIRRIGERVEAHERVLVTTLTKRMAEDLSEYLKEKGIKVNYLHSDVKTLERIVTLTKLRKGEYEVLVGVNLLREGLDLPEVSLVAVLDADKEGFLRSETSLVQVIGRAARNVRGEVVLYADVITNSIRKAVGETERRRKLQLAYNKEHHITPKTVEKEISDIVPIEDVLKMETLEAPKTKKALKELIARKEREMKEAAASLDFELAALLRDEIKTLEKK